MIRNLLATTAIATLIATGALAQTSTTTTTTPSTAEPTETQPAAGAATTQDSGAASTTAQSGTTAPADTTTQPADTTAQPADTTTQPADTTAQGTTATGTDTQAADSELPEVEGHLASNLIGSTVYNGANDDAETIGEVNDVVIGKDGKAEFIVIGVGGFLGIGEKDVAIEYETLQWAQRDGDMWLVVETSKEQLEAQPAFDRTAYDPEAMAANEQQAADQSGTATQDTAASGTATTTTTQPATQDTAASGTATTTAPATQDTAASSAETPADKQTTETAQAPATGTTTTGTQAPATGTAATDATQTAAIDRSTLQDVDMAAIRAEDFVGTTVYGANDETIGEIGDIVLTQDGQIDAVLIDVGGFLGMGEKEVAVAMDNLQFMQDGSGNRYLYTEFTKEQLDAQPAYDEGTYAQNRDTMRLTVDN